MLGTLALNGQNTPEQVESSISSTTGVPEAISGATTGTLHWYGQVDIFFLVTKNDKHDSFCGTTSNGSSAVTQVKNIIASNLSMITDGVAGSSCVANSCKTMISNSTAATFIHTVVEIVENNVLKK